MDQDKKISQLIECLEIGDEDLFIIVDNSEVDINIKTKKLKGSTLKSKLKDYFDSLYGDFNIVYGTELTDAANLTAVAHKFKTTHFNSPSNKDLTLWEADWQPGDWLVIRQYGEGIATITPQNANVKLPDTTKTNGIGQDMYIECYKIDGSDKYFHIINGTE